MRIIELILGFILIIFRIFVIYKVFSWLITSGQSGYNIAKIKKYIVFIIADYYTTHIFNITISEKE